MKKRINYNVIKSNDPDKIILKVGDEIEIVSSYPDPKCVSGTKVKIKKDDVEYEICQSLLS